MRTAWMVTAIFTFAAFGQEPDFFPLQTGNQWIYRSTGRIPTNPWVVEVGGTRMVDGREYFRVTGFPTSPLMLRKTNGALVFLNEDTRTEHLWVNFLAPQDEAFPSEIDACSKSASVVKRDAPHRGPTGEFPKALHIGYQAFCADAGLIGEVFVPGIGLAQRRMTSIAGEQVFDLVYARVNGNTAVNGREQGFTLTLDRNSYTSGATMNARITLLNTTEDALNLTFPTGQDYDLVIWDGEGKQVYRWSDGRAFPLIFRQMQFRGEQSWAVAVNLPALRPGSYVAVANLAVAEGKYEASVPFTLR